MRTVEDQLLETLTDLETAAKSMPAANPKPDLLALFEKLDALTAQLPKGTDPQLLHFLRNKSYAKARLWLAGQSELSGKRPDPGFK